MAEADVGPAGGRLSPSAGSPPSPPPRRDAASNDAVAPADAPTSELPRVPRAAPASATSVPPQVPVRAGSSTGWRGTLGALFGRKARRPVPDAGDGEPPASAGRPEPPTATALTVPADQPTTQLAQQTAAAPAEARRRKQPRAMKPLPWGRDFAAAVIHKDDGLTAVFGKLDAADSPRVALVAPRGNRELSKPLGMRRLRRHIDLSGKDVMIVTHAGSLRSRAREIGIAVVGNVRGVDFERYGRGGVRLGGVIVPLPGIGLFLRLTAFLLAIALLGAAILLYLPEATVQVYPQVQTLATTVNATVSTDTTTLNASSGEVPGHRRSLTLTRTVLYPVHGQATVKAPDGSDQQVPAPTDDDMQQAASFAQQVLLTEGRKTLEQRYKGETLFQNSATVSAFDSKTSAKTGEAADIIELNASAQVSMLSADNQALQQLLKQSLNQQAIARQMFLPDTFKATTLSSGAFDKNNNRIQVRLKLSEGATRSFNVPGLRKAVAGKSKLDAQQAIVERVDQSQPARIKLNPGWAPWLPRFTNRITVKVLQQPSATGDNAGAPGSQPTALPTPTPKPQ